MITNAIKIQEKSFYHQIYLSFSDRNYILTKLLNRILSSGGRMFNKITTMSKYILLILIAAGAGFHAVSAQNNAVTHDDRNYNIFPDEYSELDENPQQSRTDDELVLRTLEKSRQQYLQALVCIDHRDTNRAAKHFEYAIDILNRLVSYPGIEHNDEFSDLAQSILDDYETFITDIDDLDESSSLFVIRDKLFREMEQYVAISTPDIEPIIIPKDSLQKAIPGLEPITEENIEIPLDDNKYVQKSLSFLTNHKIGKKFVVKCLQRAPKWLPYLRRIAVEESMPQEIAFLSMIESAYNPNAVSRAAAVGLWQFIRSTGEIYGLNAERSMWLDERRDPEKASRAAMRHLRDLYNQFGHWHLALAAYNCGAGCVQRAIRRSGKENPDFWDIRHNLPRETRNYVPMYIAAVRVSMSPEAYGYDLGELEFEEPYKFETYELTESVNIEALAKCAGMTEEEFRGLNPELISHSTPPDVESYTIKLPTGTSQLFAARFETLSEDEKRPWIFHQIRRGETLTGIANKYGVSRKEIASINGLRSYRSRIRAGAVLRIPGVSKSEEEAGVAAGSASSAESKNITHTVKKGESLIRIARRYGITLNELRRLNDIPHWKDDLVVGQKLVISRDETAEQEEKDLAENQQQAKKGPEIEKIERPTIVRHKVRRGETLGKIADEYGVTISSIKELNHIRRSRIYAGQTLKIRTSASNVAENSAGSREKLTHKVRRGETISTIAARYGVRESEIKAWNPSKVRGNTIYSGSYLTIYPDRISKGSSSSDDNVNKPPKYYKIRRGDNLISIARKFGITVSSLKRLNKNLDERRLQVGQRIRIQ